MNIVPDPDGIAIAVGLPGEQDGRGEHRQRVHEAALGLLPCRHALRSRDIPDLHLGSKYGIQPM